jgi:rsbT antagonist protein RsbS
MERIPILRMGRHLLLTVQVDLDDALVTQLERDLMSEIVRTGATGVLIDVSGLDLVDSFIGRMLATIASSARLLGAESVVVGMRPAIAITLVELGVPLGGVHTALNVERGMEYLRALEERAGGA